MIRWITILGTILLIVAPLSAVAQIETYPVTGAGLLYVTGQKPVFGAFGGLNIPISTDTAKGYCIFNRTEVFYKNTNETQGIGSFMVARKSFNFINKAIDRLYFDFGVGGDNIIVAGKDVRMLILTYGMGVRIYKSLGIDVGVNYRPTGEGEPDQWFPKVSLDFNPAL